MNVVIALVSGLPIWAYGIAVAVAVAIVVAIIASSVSRNSFRRKLQYVHEKPEEAEERIRSVYSDKTLLRRSSLIEKFAREGHPDAVQLCGLDELWIKRLSEKKKQRDFKRVLEFVPDKGLFTCFLVSLRRSRLSRLLLHWLEENDDLLAIRRIALSGRGEDFSGAEALALFADRMDHVRELLGDPEWAARYFAVKIMLYDDADRSVRGIWDTFEDPYPLVRRTVTAEMVTDEADRLYNQLYHLFLNDPVFEVREAARKRIHSDFPDRYTVDPASLEGADQMLHVLELLQPGYDADENMAFVSLKADDLELRLPAAMYLSRIGALERLLAAADTGDMEAFERAKHLLKNAVEVNVTGFLELAKSTENPSALSIIFSILSERGPSALITPAAEKAFSLVNRGTAPHELYTQALETVQARGDDNAIRLVKGELQKKRGNNEVAAEILNHLPERSQSLLADLLLDFLTDPTFEPRAELRSVLNRYPERLLVPRLIHIITAGREVYPHAVRITALRLLGEFKLSYTLQFVLEHLRVLPIDEAREFAATLAKMAGKEFDRRVTHILESPDSSTRAALIACLPGTGKKEFLKQIRAGLDDADPDVRIACLWSLLHFDDTRSFNQAVERLRDPVERVRIETARALGEFGSADVVKRFKDTLTDENEVETVKEAAIEGLGYSKHMNAVEVLIQALSEQEEFENQIVAALANKTEKKELSRLVELFKDAEPTLRDRLTRVFKAMGEEGEQAMRGLLEEEISSLQPYLAEILETTGFVEDAIRKLAHRDPELRRDAASALSLVGTKAAFRGIVRAARDPDEDVRVQVTRALESLGSEGGQEILEDLKKDPDRRVRKYTQWALQRIESKSL